MFLSAHSHMPIFAFILVDDDFMIQACKNNTSLASELSAISKHVLVITHTHISRLLTLWVGWEDIGLFFLHGKKYILHPPTGAGVIQLGLDLITALMFTCWIKGHCTNMRIRERRQRGCADHWQLHFLWEKETEFKKHLVIPSITGTYSKTY